MSAGDRPSLILMDNLLWALLVSALCAWFCYFVATRNDMNKVGWPILGFILPLIGVFVTLAVAFMKQKDTV